MNELLISSEEYIKDGLLHCLKCHTPKQVKINGVPLRCNCDCEEEEYQLEEQKRLEIERYIIRREQIKQAFLDSNLYGCKFDSDDINTKRLKNYASNFDSFLHKGQGLLLHGSVGSGKTYLAAAVASYLFNKSYKVRMVTASYIVENSYEKKLMKDLANSDLLVLDDLGSERSTSFGQEQIFEVVDSRTRNKLPMIVTTNKSLSELNKADNFALARIYDRVLGSCLPIKFEGKSKRLEQGRFEELIRVLNG